MKEKKIQSMKKLLNKKTALFVCDIQESFRSKIVGFESVVFAANYLVSVAKELKIPILATEQMPDKLKSTVKEISFPEGTKLLSKSQFSMITAEAKEFLKQYQVENVILTGIEAHVCVLQTALELREDNIDVYIVADGTSSQRQSDRKFAFKRMESAGSVLTTMESVAFQLLRDSANPAFKALLPVFKKERPDPKLDF